MLYTYLAWWHSTSAIQVSIDVLDCTLQCMHIHHRGRGMMQGLHTSSKNQVWVPPPSVAKRDGNVPCTAQVPARGIRKV